MESAVMEAAVMEAEDLTAAVDFGRAKVTIGAQLDAAGASSAVAAAVWFLFSHEELYTWPEWRKVPHASCLVPRASLSLTH